MPASSKTYLKKLRGNLSKKARTRKKRALIARTFDAPKATLPFSVLMSIYANDDPIHLEAALDSVLNQTLPPDEIILIQDGPVSEIINKAIQKLEKQHPGLFKIIALPKNVGLGKSLKQGVLNSRNPIIARMDSDDIAHHKRFEKQIRFLMDNPDIDVVGSLIAEFDKEPDKINSLRIVPETHSEIVRFSKIRNPLNHMTIMYKRKSILNSGNYNHVPQFEDYDLWVRMLQNGAKFANIQEILVFARMLKLTAKRSGYRYFKDEFSFQKRLRRLHHFGYIGFFRNVFIRCLPRLFPKFMIAYIYQKFMRLS